MKKPHHNHVTIKPEYMPVILLAEAWAKVVPINRDYDIPYVAGYSKNGGTVYIDRHTPTGFNYKGRRIATDRLLTVHEMVEKGLEHAFGLKYIDAHNIATMREKVAVKRARLPWKVYEGFFDKFIKDDATAKLTSCPKDLDMQPYIDEHAEGLIKKIQAAQSQA